MRVEQVLGRLEQDSVFMENVAAWERVPPRLARHGETPPGLDPRLVEWLKETAMWPLYTHQAQGVAAALRREHLVVATGTASGKTLCYNLPVLQMLLEMPDATALYLFPTKALAQDQHAVLAQMIHRLDHPVSCNLYDGDTPANRRAAVRRAGGIVLTNPDMLHAGILPYHTRWAKLLANLRFVVLDEIHAYRGVFGSHVANVLRRLRRICAFYGSTPRFVCTSATIANPAEHAERLVEGDVVVVDEDGSPQGARHLILFNPPMVNPELGLRRSALGISVAIAGQFLRRDVQTLLFARSRLATEELLIALRGALTPHHLAEMQIQGYRGGYLPKERRAIERGLRDGSVRGVVATNALELGVDIGQLDACMLVGYPGTIASTRQQAGRAGRRLSTAAAVMVATANPLDQYIVNHPQFLLGGNPEHALTNPDNLVILVKHLQCAAYELPFRAHEPFGSVPDVTELLEALAELGALQQSRETYHWIGEDYPALSLSLRSGSHETVVIQDVSDGSRPVVIGEMELESAPLLLYEGAIYPHSGQDYLVEALDWDGRLAHVRPVAAEYITRASLTTSLQVLRVVEKALVGPVWTHHGHVRVTSQATAYRKLKRSSRETLGWGEIDLPPQTLETTAYWLTLTPELAETLTADGLIPAPLDYGPNWLAQRRRALTRAGGQCQECGAPERPGRQHDVHHIQPFRTFGYRPGSNDRYKAANALANLAVLCPSCHRRAERSVRMRSALAGLSSLLHNLAPLFLMCAPSDIFVLAEGQPPGGTGPTVTIYERVAAGVGFSRQLYRVHQQLLEAALDLIQACPCTSGCPACVGPSGEVGPQTKEATRQLLGAMLGAKSP